MPKTIGKYTNFTIQQPGNTSITPGLPLVFINSFLFLNYSLDNLFRNLGKNYFYYLSQQFEPNALHLVKKMECFRCDSWGSLKYIRKFSVA